MPINSSYEGKIVLKNTGQSIWSEKEAFVLKSNFPFSTDLSLDKKILPGQSAEIPFMILSGTEPSTVNLSWQGIEETVNINVFNPAQIKSYQDHFWQKMLSLVHIWWYDKKQ